MLDPISSPIFYLGNFPTDGGGTFRCTCNTYPSSTPTTLKRDPGGRVRAYWVSSVKGAGDLLNICTQPGNADPWSPDYDAQFTPETSSNKGFSKMLYGPFSAFLIGAQAMSPAPTVDNDNLGLNNADNPPLPLAEVIIADDNGELMCYSQFYAGLQQVSGDSNQAPLYILNGIIDAPMPVPNENTSVIDFRGGYSNLVGTVTYGTDISIGSSRSFSQAYTIGLQSKGQTSDGAGPAWDISFNGGCGKVSTSSQQITLVNNMPDDATLDDDKLVVPYGKLFASSYNFTCTVYRLLEPQDQSQHYSEGQALQPASDANLYYQLGVSLLPSTNGYDYVPYTVAPGDLSTYTRTAWNARMQALGYPGPNYFEDVILKNAFVFDPSTNQNYLPFSWSQSGGVTPGFSSLTGSVTETSWTFNASVYAGMSFNFEFDMFGIGEGLEGSMLYGMTVSLTGTTQTTEQQQWGISFSDTPAMELPANKPKGYTSYNFNVYFLPANQQWAEEFQKYADFPVCQAAGGTPTWNNSGAVHRSTYTSNPGLDVAIDSSSKPWRIVFEVTEYQLQDGTQYGGLVEQIPAAPVLPDKFLAAWCCDLSTGGNGVWVPGAQVRYGVSFANGPAPGSAETEISWGDAETIGGYMCGSLTLPIDQSGWAVVRNIYRQFLPNGQLEQIGTVPDNVTTSWYDLDPLYNVAAPSAIGDPNNGAWTQRSNVPYSNVWVPGNVVTYTMTFVWSDGRESPASAPSPAITVAAFACPTFDGLPVWNGGLSSYGAPSGRNIYRQCKDQYGSLISSQLAGSIPDAATTTTWTDGGAANTGAQGAAAS